jgi:hypothetical protein
VGRAAKISLGVLLTLIVLVVVADRVGVVVAERSAESKLASYAQFEQKPTVHVHGVPFLTQAFGGRYDDIELTSNAVRLGSVTGSNLDVHLRGAHIPLRDLIGGHVQQVPVDKADGTVVVPYDALVAQSGVQGLQLSSEGSQIVAAGRLTLPDTSVGVDVKARGTLSVSAGQVSVNVSEVTVNGATVPGAISDQVATLVGHAISLPKLPFQLQTAQVVAAPNGARITATAKDVVLRANAG